MSTSEENTKISVESCGKSEIKIQTTCSSMKSDAGIKLYKRRWVILLLFSLYSACNAFQWIEYGIINDAVSQFYDVDRTTVNWLSVVYMVAYIPLIVPVAWFLDKKGFRATAITGAALNAIGALIKIASAQRHLFWVTMTGQVVCAVAQVFILGMPSKLAATWFGPKEVSTACSFAVFGNQIGIAIGFLTPPYVIEGVEKSDFNEMSNRLFFMFIVVAGIATLLAVLVILVVRAKPKKPPSQAQARQRCSCSPEPYWISIKKLVLSGPSLLLIVSYGINTGSFYAIGTLLSEEIQSSFQDSTTAAGRIGLTTIVAGMVGSMLCGVWLDRTRLYKKTTVGIYFFTLLFLGAYSATLGLGHLWIVYITSGLLGFTMTGYLAVGFEFAAEITFPVSEGTSSGLLNASAQVFGIMFTLVMGRLIFTASVLAANAFICAALVVGFVLTVSIKSKLKRQLANMCITDCDN